MNENWIVLSKDYVRLLENFNNHCVDLKGLKLLK